jgi:signal transduction histidine kinase
MGPLRILLVDDDEVDRRAVKRLLRQAAIDATVTEHADRMSALAAAHEQTFDCALLDYRLPGADGVSLLRDLREMGVGVPVVALTGQGDEEVAVELMKAGAADYLNKNGLTAERLERSLRYALALHHAEEERRLLLEREQQARLQAQAANRAKDLFLTTLSHELRTPLNAILGWTQLLAGGQLDPPTARRAIEIIERNTRLQVRLIDDLLDISRIVAGKLRLDLRPVPVHGIVSAAIESVLPAASAKDLTVARECSSDNATILCDPSRMQQVIWNLLSNAIKFTPSGGRITVTESVRGRTVELSVSDTGIGIQPEFLPHVFDRFRQQDPASTRKHGGLGLGLSIVRYLVELHGGSISASSLGDEQGATFCVLLPLATAVIDSDEHANDDDADGDDERPTGPLPASGGKTDLTGISVLVVDNEPDARGLVKAILENAGATVVAVESAAEAMAEISRQRPDVLLSDIGMPGEDGYALIRRVRQMDPPETPLPAAALTAYATAGDRAKVLLAGFQEHVPKPFEPARLTSIVATLARANLSTRP